MAKFRPRSELKYLLHESQVEFVRQIAACFMDKDTHGDDGNYVVESLYLDTANWMAAYTTDEGIANRFKLRVRRYETDESAPLFFEIKEKIGNSVLKQRAITCFEDSAGILEGRMPSDRGFRSLIEDEQDSLLRFRNLMDSFDMRPRLWVRYEREAWTSPFGDGARLTFDRCVEVQPAGERDPLDPRLSWVNATTDPPVILELKFSGFAPAWMHKIVRCGELHRQSASKYGAGARLMGNTPFTATHGGVAWNP